MVVLVVAAVLPVACGSDGDGDPAPPAEGAPQQPPAAPEPQATPGLAPPAVPAEEPAVRVEFKLDPRLTDGLYMGERWVSPPVYHAATQAGDTFRQEARVVAAGPDVAWTPSDPDAVTVSPPHGQRIEITVSRTGRSTLTVAVDGHSTVLTIDAAHENGVWRVTIAR